MTSAPDRVRALLVTGASLLVAWAALAVGVPEDPWFAAAARIRAEAQPSDLVLLVPSERADRVGAFSGLTAVALDPAALHDDPRLHRAARWWVVTDESVGVPPVPGGVVVLQGQGVRVERVSPGSGGSDDPHGTDDPLSPVGRSIPGG